MSAGALQALSKRQGELGQAQAVAELAFPAASSTTSDIVKVEILSTAVPLIYLQRMHCSELFSIACCPACLICNPELAAYSIHMHTMAICAKEKLKSIS